MDQSKQKNYGWLVYAAIFGYLVLVSVGFYFLYISQTGVAILSPWQTIHLAFIYIFFAATLVLGLLIVFVPLDERGRIFSAPTVLGLLIFHSFLLHGYLPLTHKLFYGGDQWRHMANEQQLLQGNWPDKPVLRDGTQDGLNAGDMAYGVFWVVEAGIAKVTTLGLITINKWLLPILWPICFPLLLYGIGRKLFVNGVGAQYFVPSTTGMLTNARVQNIEPLHDDRLPLLLVWLSFLPFSLQAAGSFTLPVNFGFLIWLAEMLLIFRYLQNPERKRLYILLLVGALSIFNYTLFFVLYWVGLGVAIILLKMNGFNVFPSLRRRGHGPPAAPEHKRWRAGEVNAATQRPLSPSPLLKGRRIVIFVMAIAVALVLPLAEIIAGYSRFDPAINWFAQIKQLIGNFTALYLAAGPRPHDIATGNIIFNQMPSYAFVENVFTAWRWWLVVFMVGFWGLVALGWKRFWQISVETRFIASLAQRWIAVFGAGLFASYIISRYFLTGENVFTRRLDVVLALFFIVFAAAGIEWLVERKWWRKWFIIPLVFVFSVATTASYTLGPDVQTVSIQEYQAMQYIWEYEQEESDHCVVADTYPLLALEAISGKEIVGGGFPINEYFAQPEREQALAAVAANNEKLFRDTIKSLSADHCWFVTRLGPPPFRGSPQVVRGQIFGDYLFDTIDVARYTK